MQPSSGFPPLGPHYSHAHHPHPHYHHHHPPPHHPSPGPAGGGSPEGTWKRQAGELERSLQFLQRQHGETLSKLHEEVELLRRENKELHYRLIMQPALQKTTDFPLPAKQHSRGSSVSKSPRGSKIAAEDHQEDEFLNFLPVKKTHSRVGSVSKTPRGSRAASDKDARENGPSGPEELEEKATVFRTNVEAATPEAEQVGETPEEPTRATSKEEVTVPIPEPKETTAKEAPYRETELCDRTTSPNPPPSPTQSRAGDVRIPLASSNPFLANILPSCMRKPPTLEECEAIIRQLWNISHMQMQELMYLRTCLEDIHRTRRIPEDYMLAGHLRNPQTTWFPRVKNPPKQCRMLTPLPAAERAILPALKQTLGNAFAERQKRAQAIQRKRFHRMAL